MSFLTEDPDTVNTIIAEEEREAMDVHTALHNIRSSRGFYPFNGGRGSLPTPYGDDKSDKWSWDMHPKD